MTTNQATADNETQVAPDYSINEDPANLLFRIDSGRFMETVYRYVDMVYNDKTGTLDYTVFFSSLVIGSIVRDPKEVDQETLAEFYNTVSSPIMLDLQQQLRATNE